MECISLLRATPPSLPPVNQYLMGYGAPATGCTTINLVLTSRATNVRRVSHPSPVLPPWRLYGWSWQQVTPWASWTSSSGTRTINWLIALVQRSQEARWKLPRYTWVSFLAAWYRCPDVHGLRSTDPRVRSSSLTNMPNALKDPGGAQSVTLSEQYQAKS